jgi:TolA-binding protein
MVYGANEGEGAPVVPETPLFDGPSDEPQDEPTADAPQVETQPDFDQFEIGGTTYTRAELESYVNDGKGMKPVLTKKTQEFSEVRKELEAELQAANARLEDLESRLTATDSEDGEMDFATRLQRDVQDIKEKLQKQERVRDAELGKLQRENEFEAAIESVSGWAHCNPTELRSFMDQWGFEPHQVQPAYQALYGGKVSRAIGEREAIIRGAQAPAPMGASDSRISPSFTSPHDAPGVNQDIANTSWDDLQKMAQADPNIPKHRTY